MKHGFALTLLAAASVACAQAPAANADLEKRIEIFGRINGQALACGHAPVAARVKTLMISHVPKLREHGEIFERATTAAFLAQGQDKAACPPAVALTIELETTARPLFQTPATAAVAEEPATAGIHPRYLLQATNGRAVMDGDFSDRFQLIAFGYTFCPDICPTTLIDMTAILKALGGQAGKLQPVFISVDPERDTLAHLRQYLAFFDARILGATGSPELVRRAAESFKVRYEKIIDPKATPDQYAMDHTAGMYLLAPGGQFLARFPYGMPAADIASRIEQEILARPTRQGD